MKLRTLAVAVAIGIGVCPGAISAGDLRLDLSGIEEEVGSVRVALFASAADFEAQRQWAGHFTAARKDGLAVVFANLPPGRYGISCYHDANGNEELDRNLVGMPTEPYGFSRNARGRFGPPSFDDLSFEVGTADLALEVELR